MKEPASPSQPTSYEPLRVLFIEDNPNDVELELQVLSAGGFAVEYAVATTREQMDQLVTEGDFDLLISDFELAGWNGLDALEQLRRSAKDIPFIIVTGTLGEERAVECLHAGVADYLLKGRLSRLPAVIRRVMAGKAAAAEHRRAEERVRRSEEYFRSMIENVSDIISIVDSAGTFLFFSPSVEAILGYRPVDLIGRDAYSLVHEEDVSKLRSMIEEGFARAPARPQEFRFRHRDDSWRVLESRANYPRHGSGLSGVIVTSRDVTDQHKAEEELKDSEERFRGTFEQAAVGMAHVGLDGRWLKVNRKLCEIVGYSAEELLRRTFQDITHPDDAAADVLTVHRALKGEIDTYTREKRYLCKNGSVAWVSATVSLLRTAARVPKYFISVIEDVTERRRAKEAVLESEARFRQLAENVQEVFWLANLDKSEMFYASPAFEKIWGLPTQALYADPRIWIESVHPEDYDRIERAAGCRRIGEPYDEEYRIQRRDGSVSWIRDRAFPIRDADGNVYRLAGIAEDITRNKQLEAQFLQAQKMESVGRLAGGVAHDFNNLLTAIGSFARLAMETLEPGSQAHGDLEQVLTATDRAAGVTRQLLTFARQQIFQPVIVDPNKVIANLEKMLSRLVRENIELVFRSSADVGRVRADPGQLDQVIINLVVNATDAMPDGGTLTIETGIAYLNKSDIEGPFEVTAGKFVMLSVSDTGIGMSEENQARLFEPFFTTKPVGKGTGLGLATVYGIVTQSGGYMKVSSRLGDGSAFRIYLPCVEEAPVAASPSQTNPRPQQGSETILLAEDQEEVRKLIIQVVRSAGYSVLEAENGEHALEVMRQNPDGKVDLLITDVIMPKMGGKELAERLHPFQPKMRVLYISGYTDQTFTEEGILSPDTAFLHKPFLPGSLLAKVREVLDAPVAPKI